MNPTMQQCYLDNSATTRPFDEVIAEMSSAMAERWYNPSAAYAAGIAVEGALAVVRERLLAALGSRGTAVFTSGGTEADNLALFGALGARQTGLVVSAVEHPAVLRAADQLKARGCEVTVVPVDRQGVVSTGALLEAVNGNTALVSIMHCNNETGAVNDIAGLSSLVKGYYDEMPDLRH